MSTIPLQPVSEIRSRCRCQGRRAEGKGEGEGERRRAPKDHNPAGTGTQRARANGTFSPTWGEEMIRPKTPLWEGGPVLEGPEVKVPEFSRSLRLDASRVMKLSLARGNPPGEGERWVEGTGRVVGALVWCVARAQVSIRCGSKTRVSCSLHLLQINFKISPPLGSAAGNRSGGEGANGGGRAGEGFRHSSL